MTSSTRSFLELAPPPGASRERYFEGAVDLPAWYSIPLGQGVVIRVSQDVVKAGGVRVPLWPSTAQRIADRYDAMLPTKTLSDAIWRAATVKLTPRSMSPRPGVTRDSNVLLGEHEALVERARAGRVGLIAGAKKDIIIGRQAHAHPEAVTIYGWHQSNGEAIQSVFSGHSATYSDYSHGARLVSKTAAVDGRDVPIATLIADPRYASLFSSAGVLSPDELRYPTSIRG